MPNTDATVLIAEDDPGIRLVINQTLVREGYKVKATESVDALMKWLRQGEGDVVVTDVYLGEETIFDSLKEIRRVRPETPVIVISAQNTILTAASAMDRGATDYLPKPFRIDDLSDKVARALERVPRRGRLDKGRSRSVFDAELPLMGRSEAMQEVYRRISRVMNSDLPVLVVGEMGTGKARAASAMHTLGRRKAQPLINLMAWLYGVDDGHSAPDILEAAQGGTIFAPELQRLDRAGQLRLELLLDSMEAAQSEASLPRLISSATKELWTRVGEGLFPVELLHRVNVVPIELPPLRERREDIPDLVASLLELDAESEMGGPRKFDDAALGVLGSYDWPGNVRELKSFVSRIHALCPHEVVTATDVAPQLQALPMKGTTDEADFDASLASVIEQHFHPELAALGEDDEGQAHQQAIRAVEKPLIALALKLTRGNKLRAAAMLGMNRNTLRARIQALGME